MSFIQHQVIKKLVVRMEVSHVAHELVSALAAVSDELAFHNSFTQSLNVSFVLRCFLFERLELSIGCETNGTCRMLCV